MRPITPESGEEYLQAVNTVEKNAPASWDYLRRAQVRGRIYPALRKLEPLRGPHFPAVAECR